METVINRIRTGRMALPNFQREFVWGPSQVVDLLDTISRQWPIGTLLLLSGPQPFATKAIDSGPAIDSNSLDLYILDGQQRLTAMYHAFADVSDYVYYIDFKAASNDGEDFIKWARRSRFKKAYPSIAARAQDQIALVSEIWESDIFFEWMRLLPKPEMSIEILSVRDRRLAGLNPKVYHAMALQLDHAIELEALARIFESINRTGISLNAFDLLIAKLIPTGFDLRQEWDAAKEVNPTIKLLSPPDIEPLKLVSLLIRTKEGKKLSRGVRQGDILALDVHHIRAYWSPAISLYEATLKLCRDRFGVANQDVVPNWTMLLGVASKIMRNCDVESISSYWRESILRQSFSQAANTRIVAEFDEAPEVGSFLELTSQTQEDWVGLPARSNGILLRGTAGLLIAKGAIDALSGERLATAASVRFRALDAQGRLRPLSKSDDISRVFLLSGESEKRLPRETPLSEIKYGLDAAVSQGFDNYMNRQVDDFRKLIAPSKQ